MTREELRDYVDKQRSLNNIPYHVYSALIDGIDTLAQEPSRDMEEIKEVINCDADAETKCKIISNILTAKLHYFEEPFDNRPCISSGVCEHDKQNVLGKIRADLYKLYNDRPSDYNHSQRTELFCEVIKILNKYKAEVEPQEREK